MITLILFVSTFNTANYCEYLYYSNNKVEFEQMRCNEDAVRWEFYSIK